jgi:hypothetical protein
MNCPYCKVEQPRTCTFCDEKLCCAKGVARCFAGHPLPPARPRLVAEIIETADTEAGALERIARVDEFHGCIARWRPYRPDRARIAAGVLLIREFWSDSRKRAVEPFVPTPPRDCTCATPNPGRHMRNERHWCLSCGGFEDLR